MKEFTVEINDDLYNYLEFLERTRFIKNKNEALHKALLLFKKLSMHDWLPDIYRIGENRILIMDRGMLLDIFESLTENETYRVGSTTALKRKVLKPEFRDLNLTQKANWPLVLKELENLGWGVFEKIEDEIRIEHAAVPALYLKGYLETMFKVKLEEHYTNITDLIVFKVKHPKEEIWF
ncbi:MAG: hypothetical protein NWE89_05485 [Candidatus Bathyarchaeota archaeon]|nr:hypothetical protein [Candidatus Bathyarchaeota archaeon]